jgi:hypothetical protein
VGPELLKYSKPPLVTVLFFMKTQSNNKENLWELGKVG